MRRFSKYQCGNDYLVNIPDNHFKSRFECLLETLDESLGLSEEWIEAYFRLFLQTYLVIWDIWPGFCLKSSN